MASAVRSFLNVVEVLRERLEAPLPGAEAQLRMAPVYRQDMELVTVEGKACREAAVMAVLFPIDEEAHLLFTVRHQDLADHVGQIAFPGGRLDTGETYRVAALRETYEEVGLPPDHIEVLGALTPLYIPPTNFCVYPFVGATSDQPDLIPHDAEVTELVEVPLTYLLDSTNRRKKPWELHGEMVDVPFYHVSSSYGKDLPPLWGATAMMLSELLALFED